MNRYFPTSPFHSNGYPSHTRRPMAEGDHHRNIQSYLITALMLRYQTRPDVYASGSLLIYFERGDRRRRIVPDCFVCFGSPNHDRTNYLLWEEHVSPGVVIEVTSKARRREDQRKPLIYKDVLRVRELYQFDPFGEYLTPHLQGFRLVDGEYQPVPPHPDGSIASEQLGLELQPRGPWLWLWDAAARRALLASSVSEPRAVQQPGESPAAHSARLRTVFPPYRSRQTG